MSHLTSGDETDSDFSRLGPCHGPWMGFLYKLVACLFVEKMRVNLSWICGFFHGTIVLALLLTGGTIAGSIFTFWAVLQWMRTTVCMVNRQDRHR